MHRNAMQMDKGVLSAKEHVEETLAADGNDKPKPAGHEAIGGLIVHRGVQPLYVSEAWAALHGYKAADVLAMESIEPLRHPDDRARMAEYAIERAAGRYAPERYAYRALHRDGYFVWIDVSVCVFPWQGEPAILCTIVGVRDASGTPTGQTQAGRPSERSVKQRFLYVIDQLPDGFALYDADERLIFWNQRYITYSPKLGRRPRCGDRFEALIRDHTRHGRIKEAIGEEEAWIAKRLAVFRAPDNQSIDVSFSGRIVKARHIKTNDGGTLLILTDVTEARATARSLSIYDSAIEQVADQVSIVDLEYRFIFVNRALRQFHRKKQGSFIGRHVAEIIGEEQFKSVSKEDLDRCFSGETVRTHRIRRNTNGQPLHFELTLEPFRDDDSAIVGAIAVLRDVTEATKRNDDLRLARSVIDQLSERFIVVDSEEKVRLANECSLNFYCREPSQVIGHHLTELIGQERYDGNVAQQLKRVLATGARWRHEYWRSNPDGEPRYWETSIVPYRESDSRISGAIATSRDMTVHHRAKQERQQFQEAIEHIADGYALFDRNERLVACNRYYRQKHAALTSNFGLGVSYEKIIRRRIEARTILDAIGQEEAWIAGRLKGFRSDSHIREFQESSGNWIHVRNRRTADGGTLLVMTDITESKRIEEALAKSQSRFKDFTELAADWFWEQDSNGCYTYVSESIGMLTKRPVSELLGKNPIQVFGSSIIDNPAWRSLWQELQSTGVDRTVELEHDLTASDGRLYRARSVVRPIKNDAGLIIGYRGAAKDVTENHNLAKQLEYQANHDTLTGLLNRRSFERHLDQAIKASVLSRRPRVFCFIDLDQFKIVNDTAGHLAGDRLLQQVADLLNAKTRKGDVLARLGGDEFGLLLHDCSLRRAQNMTRKLIAALNEDRFLEGDNVFEIGASIGLTQISSADSSVDQLMAEADLACYAAKDAGRNRVKVYLPDDRQLALRREEMSKASLIRRALDDGQFTLFAQPMSSLARPSESPAGYEVLLRMVSLEGSLSVPSDFISAGERFGLMPEVDRWVIKQCFRDVSCILADQRDVRININLSGLSLNEEGLVPFIMNMFQTSLIKPDNVCFEITETAAIRSLAKTKRIMAKLKKVGCRFALDDFGRGLSSFNYLKQLPVDFLKIDGAFIRDLRTDQRSRTMVEAIHQVAKSLGLETVAECVETEEAYHMLQDIGVDMVQGYFVGKPRPLADWLVSQAIAV